MTLGSPILASSSTGMLPGGVVISDRSRLRCQRGKGLLTVVRDMVRPYGSVPEAILVAAVGILEPTSRRAAQADTASHVWLPFLRILPSNVGQVGLRDRESAYANATPQCAQRWSLKYA